MGGRYALARYVTELSGKRRPRVCIVATATGDADSTILALYTAYSPFTTELSWVRFFQRTPRDLHSLILKQDIVCVGGGNTKSMLGVWREYGFDAILAEAYAKGIIMCGSSAGSICWFEEGVTDSYDEVLTPLKCLGFLRGSNCPSTIPSPSAGLHIIAWCGKKGSAPVSLPTTASGFISSTKSWSASSARCRKQKPTASSSPGES